MNRTELIPALDALARGNQAQRERLRAAAAPVASVERALGLKFAPGDQVIDLITGQKGTIDGGHAIPRHVEGTGTQT